MEGRLECSSIRTVNYANHGVLIDHGHIGIGDQEAWIRGIQTPL